MALGEKDVQSIAHLARIAITDEDIPGYAQDLGNILALVEDMNAVSTDGVEPMAHPLDTTQRLRADEVTEENQREKFQQNSPATENGLFLVPKVIE